jgi:hypothetical protein
MLRYTTKVTCDAHGCSQTFKVTGTEKPVPHSEVLRWARAQGWRRRHVPETADLCPDHAHMPR